MNYVVFDTETTSLVKPFCYNVGYVIIADGTAVAKKDFVIEQIWHNLALFSSAYYADKRPIYIERMRARRAILDKWGYVCQEMIRDFKKWDVQCAFAYNSPFDDKVFSFNCDWFKCVNPFDDISIYDIMGYAHHYIVDDNYKAFCEENELFTESGNYSTTAEAMYRYLFLPDFEEEHTALADSIVENEILIECVRRGAVLGNEYSTMKSIERLVQKELIVQDIEKNKTIFTYNKITIKKGKEETKIFLK